jgi:hypothetical protein
MEKLFMRGGQVYTVTNTPAVRPTPATDAGVIAAVRRWWESLIRAVGP